jgi:AcrR family transcriptional regulator
VSSTSATPQRRAPQQARAAIRRAKFLEVAADLIGEVGFDALTMTAIAEHACASIGTLYDYFPDKQALGMAIMAQYAAEADEHWERVLKTSSKQKKAALADLFIEQALAFARIRPAYLPLFGAPFVFQRSAAARQPLRKTFAVALRRLNPSLTPDQAYISAHVVVELIKGLLSLLKQIEPKDRDPATLEFKKLMRFYLSDVVKGNTAPQAGSK